MISQIRSIVQSFMDIKKYKSSKDREKRILELFDAYFYFYDICYDAKKILKNMNQNPIEYIKRLDKKSLRIQIDLWDKFLRNQSVRLYVLQNYIYDNSFLAVLNPKAVNSIKEVVGYKLDTVKTLHGLGSGLFFRNIFPKDEEPKNIAELVIETLTFSDKFCIDTITKELNLLEDELEKFSFILKEIVGNKEFIELSDKSRNRTLL